MTDRSPNLAPAAGTGRATSSSYTMTIEITNNHVYVPVQAGSRRLWFLLDTGAGVTLLNMRTAAQLDVPLGATFAVRGAGEGELTGAMLSAPLDILPGGYTGLAMGVPAAMPLADLEPHEGRPIDGILGYDFLKHHIVSVDYGARRIYLDAAGTVAYAGSGTHVPITFTNNHPHVTASMQLTSGAVDHRGFRRRPRVVAVGDAHEAICRIASCAGRHFTGDLRAGRPWCRGSGAHSPGARTGAAHWQPRSAVPARGRVRRRSRRDVER